MLSLPLWPLPPPTPPSLAHHLPLPPTPAQEVVNPLPEDQVEYDVNGDLDAQDYMRSYQG
jgi:hypothetical protein